MLCYTIFEFHLCYALIFSAQNTNSVKRLHLLQKKSLRILFSQSRNSNTGILFKDSKIIKSFDKMLLKTVFLSSNI